MERRDLSIKAATVVSGMAIVSQLESLAPYTQTIGGIVAALAVVSLVFGFSAKARDASTRATQWGELNAKIEAAGENGFTEKMLDEWGAAAATIEYGEAAPNEAILLQSHAKACKYTGNELLSGPSRWQRLPIPRQIA